MNPDVIPLNSTSLMHDIYENAVTSIQLGVADSKSGDATRSLAAVRNIHAGIALLYKEKLRQLSPPDSEDALLMDVVKPILTDGVVNWVGTGKSTVGNREIKRRFKSLGIDIDERRFDRVANLRNNVEHYHCSEPERIVQEIIGIAFVLIRDFIIKHLTDDPKVVLGDPTWSTMLESNGVFEKERLECESAMSAHSWPTPQASAIAEESSCKRCNSVLIRPNDFDEIECRACGETDDTDSHIESAISDQFYHRTYETKGFDPGKGRCPECNRETYLIDEDVCAVCGSSRDYEECGNCGQTLGLDEQDIGGLCFHCDYVMSKG